MNKADVDNKLPPNAALKTKLEKLLSVKEAKAYSKKLIRKWAGNIASPAASGSSS